jgi:cyclic pyranopterin phosphate synthase
MKFKVKDEAVEILKKVLKNKPEKNKWSQKA